MSNHLSGRTADVPEHLEVGTLRLAVCVVPGVFRLVPSAVTVNGVPLNAATTPLICQSSTIAFTTSSYPLPSLCHGS